MKKISLPVTPAHKGSNRPLPGKALLDASFCRAVLGVLLVRNGGQTLMITQADLDAITGLHVLEGLDASGNLLIGLGYSFTPEEKKQ